MEKSIKIDVPKGYEIDKEKSTFERIVFKPIIEENLPECWEDLKSIEGYYTEANSSIGCAEPSRIIPQNMNIWPTYKEAEASIALAQLFQLRNAYNGDWTPDWEDYDERKYQVITQGDQINVVALDDCCSPLVFKSLELGEKFISCPKIRELIEKASPMFGLF